MSQFNFDQLRKDRELVIPEALPIVGDAVAIRIVEGEWIGILV